MSGLTSQIGFASETQYGTAVTVDHFYPLVDESLTNEIERIESAGIVAGATVLRSDQWAPGNKMAGGDVGMELWEQNTALLFEHMLGSITSSGTTAPFTHTATPGSIDGDSLTVQVGIPPVSGSVVPFTFAGAKVASWEVGLATGENATLGLTLLASDATTGTALAAANFIADAAKPFTFVQGSVTISGQSECVRAINISGENNLSEDRRCIGDDTIDEPQRTELMAITGTMTIEFTSTEQYAHYVAADEVPVVLSLSSPNASTVITMNVRYDGVTPTVEGRGLVVSEIPFKAIATTQDSDAITVVIRNSQSSP